MSRNGPEGSQSKMSCLANEGRVVTGLSFTWGADYVYYPSSEYMNKAGVLGTRSGTQPLNKGLGQ